MCDLTFCLSITLAENDNPETRLACLILTIMTDQLSIKYQGTGVEKLFIPVLTVDWCQSDIV